MRHSIAYIISALVHIAVIALLVFADKEAIEKQVEELPEEITIDLQMFEPTPPSAPAPEKPKPKPVVKKAKPTPVKKVQPPPPPPVVEQKVVEEEIVEIAEKIVEPEIIEPLPIPEPEPTIDWDKIQEIQLDKPEEPIVEVVEAPVTETVESRPSETVVEEAPTPQLETSSESDSESSIVYNPSYKKQRPVKYPRSAKRKKLEGTVMIRADIDSNGRVKKAWTHESSGHEVLDKAAIRSVKGWVFTPAQKDGSSVASTVQFPIVFQLR